MQFCLKEIVSVATNLENVEVPLMFWGETNQLTFLKFVVN